MAIIKRNDLKAKPVTELQSKLDELSVEIAREKGSIEATGKPQNKKYREMRKLRARIITFLHKNAKKAPAQQAPVAAATAKPATAKPSAKKQ